MSHLSANKSGISEGQSDNNDIDLLGLVYAILNTWKIWLVSVLTMSIIFLGVQAFKVLTQEPNITYSKPIRLTFPNAHKHVFPSGAKFVPSDIVAPAVVQQAFERNKLSSFNISVADLQAGLTAGPYSPSYPFIIEYYNRLLDNKKLSPDHIAELRKQLEKEVAQATSGEILISWKLNEKSIPRSVAEKVLNDIPAIWADQAIKEKGVLEINANLATTNALNSTLILNEETLIAGDILAEKLSLLKANIEELSSFEGSQTITDPKTNMRLIDLSNAIDDLNKYTIRSFIAPIRSQGLSNTPNLSTYYYLDKLNALKIRLSSLQSQADAVKESLFSFSNGDRIGSAANNEGANPPALMTQLSSDMLDKLINMSSDAGREKYKQKLNTNWLSLKKSIADTQSKITETEYILNALDKASIQSKEMNIEHARYLARAKEELPEIIQQISNYFSVSERIAKQLRSETIGIKEQLYIPVTNTVIEKSTVINIKSIIVIWIALIFLTSIFVVPGCMVYNAIKTRPKN